MAILIDLAWRAITGDPETGIEAEAEEGRSEASHARTNRPAGGGGLVVWVGLACHPYPPALVGWTPRGGADTRLLDASVFVDPASREERIWAIEQAARCPGVAMVAGDGQGLRMAESRRLQLAAGRERGAPVLLARPAWERGEISAARTRWLAGPAPGDDACPPRQGRWAVELIHRKAASPHAAPIDNGAARHWIVRRDHATPQHATWHTDRPAERAHNHEHDRPAGDGGLAPRLVDRPPTPARTA